MVFDSHRGVMVLVGGLYDSNFQTWEFDGTTWTERTTATVPSTRSRFGLAYDSARRRVVMYGGELLGNPFDETWEYDGTDWILVTTSTNPGSRTEVGMAYDDARGEVVLVGGRNQSTFYNDTWVYDGGDWQQENKGDLPTARRGVGLTYDPDRERIVMFGGSTSSGLIDETWEWDGRRWTQVFPAESPDSRIWVRLTYDAGRGKVLAFGGDAGSEDRNDTWTWDGANWTRIAVSGEPSARSSMPVAYDLGIDEVVMYGGVDGYSSTLYPRDTWHWTPEAGWVEHESAGEATGGYGFPLVYDSARPGLVGYSGGYPLVRDVQEYAGTPRQWDSTSTGAAGPDPRVRYGIAHVPSMGGTVFFGGHAEDDLGFDYRAGDTWVLDGYSWTERFPAQSPSPRDSVGMTYHESVDLIVLYGGREDSSTMVGFSDTWLFDGTDWSLQAAESLPGPRYHAELVYDVVRARSVLFGGGSPLQGVTWEFDGTEWISRSTPFQPDTRRCFFGMTYDESRDVVLLFGGKICATSVYFNDTWAYGTDPDGDGIVGGLDNCRETVNDDQANADGDPAGDACDCAAADSTAWFVPEEVSGLELSGVSPTSLSWADHAGQWSDEAVYDVVSGTLANLRATGTVAAAGCEADDLAAPSWNDGRPAPAPSEGYYYLVRAANACGEGTYGHTTGGGERLPDPGCP